jgi:UDP-GlcNAc:undecaprenyl-phosphate GlcNAc-1-phosphate transferase
MLQVTGNLSFGLDWIEWSAVHLMAFVGLIDDRFNLAARYKAAAGLAVAMILAFHVTQSMDRSFSYVPFLGVDLPNHPALIGPLLLMWFWALPQAFNLIDGINGLAMGLAALLLGVFGWNLGQPSGWIWGGVAAVFLLNFPKAQHFLGDCGALMLGSLFAILGVKAFGTRDPNLLLWVFAYPIVDVCLVVGIRRWQGAPLSGADRSHLHHWMLDQVNGKAWKATPILLGLAGLPMLRATSLPGYLLMSNLGLLALAILSFKAFKDRVSKPKDSEPTAKVRREVPFMAPSALREASGSHPKL